MQIVNVTDIKIKTGVTKTGAKAGDPWELIIITGDDGSEFTTFDKAAKEVGIGGIMELEPVIKAGKTNFTKFTIKKKGQAPAPVPESGDRNGMTPELWAEKDRLERWSRECNTCFMGITELAGTEQFAKLKSGSDETGDKLTKVLHEALDWASDHFTAKPVAAQKAEAAPEKDEKKTTKPPVGEGNGAPPLKNVGELFARAAKFGISSRDVLEAVKVGTREEIIDFDEAWIATANKFASTIKAVQEANK